VALAKINLCAGRHNDRFSRLARVKKRREAKRPCWHKGKTWSQGIKHRIGVVYVQLENKNLQFRISTILEIAISEVSAWSDSQPTMLADIALHEWPITNTNSECKDECQYFTAHISVGLYDIISRSQQADVSRFMLVIMPKIHWHCLTKHMTFCLPAYRLIHYLALMRVKHLAHALICHLRIICAGR